MATRVQMGRWYGWVLLACALTACGGGDPAIDGANSGCSVAEEQSWLRSYMRDWYYWAGHPATPSPDPAPNTTTYPSVLNYFNALLLPGEGRANSTHTFSYIQDTASYNRRFVEGQSLDYGLFVNGLEGVMPLKLRYVEPDSPGGRAGLRRGDVVVSINGVPAADLLMSQQFNLNPDSAGQVLNVVIDRSSVGGAGPTNYRLASASYSLTPVTGATVLTLPNGRKAAYLSFKDFIPAGEAPLGNAFASFAAQGATELILDLRYNPGGRISTSNWLASLVAGVAGSDKLFTRLNYNSRHQDANHDFVMPNTKRPGYSRVVVLTGSRTCSASELVVNGLKPYVTVVTLGNTTCGKPVGFSPKANCASTYSAVNFESVNAQGAGGYYDGIPATCAATEDFSGVLGDASEKLTAAALSYLQTGTCPVAGAAPGPQARALSVSRTTRGLTTEPGERQGMWAD